MTLREKISSAVPAPQKPKWCHTESSTPAYKGEDYNTIITLLLRDIESPEIKSTVEKTLESLHLNDFDNWRKTQNESDEAILKMSFIEQRKTVLQCLSLTTSDDKKAKSLLAALKKMSPDLKSNSKKSFNAILSGLQSATNYDPPDKTHPIDRYNYNNDFSAACEKALGEAITMNVMNPLLASAECSDHTCDERDEADDSTAYRTPTPPAGGAGRRGPG